MYLMVIGSLNILYGEGQATVSINAHKVVDMSDDPNRETLW